MRIHKNITLLNLKKLEKIRTKQYNEPNFNEYLIGERITLFHILSKHLSATTETPENPINDLYMIIEENDTNHIQTTRFIQTAHLTLMMLIKNNTPVKRTQQALREYYNRNLRYNFRLLENPEIIDFLLKEGIISFSKDFFIQHIDSSYECLNAIAKNQPEHSMMIAAMIMNETLSILFEQIRIFTIRLEHKILEAITAPKKTESLNQGLIEASLYAIKLYHLIQNTTSIPPQIVEIIKKTTLKLKLKFTLPISIEGQKQKIEQKNINIDPLFDDLPLRSNTLKDLIEKIDKIAMLIESRSNPTPLWIDLNEDNKSYFPTSRMKERSHAYAIRDWLKQFTGSSNFSKKLGQHEFSKLCYENLTPPTHHHPFVKALLNKNQENTNLVIHEWISNSTFSIHLVMQWIENGINHELINAMADKNPKHSVIHCIKHLQQATRFVLDWTNSTETPMWSKSFENAISDEFFLEKRLQSKMHLREIYQWMMQYPSSVFHAAQINAYDFVMRSLDSGIVLINSINPQNNLFSHSNTLLGNAILGTTKYEIDEPKTIQALIKRGSQIDITIKDTFKGEEREYNLFQWLALGNKPRICTEELLEDAAIVNRIKEIPKEHLGEYGNQYPALKIALQNQKVKIVSFLIEMRARISELMIETEMNLHNAFHLACGLWFRSLEARFQTEHGKIWGKCALTLNKIHEQNQDMPFLKEIKSKIAFDHFTDEFIEDPVSTTPNLSLSFLLKACLNNFRDDITRHSHDFCFFHPITHTSEKLYSIRESLVENIKQFLRFCDIQTLKSNEIPQALKPIIYEMKKSRMYVIASPNSIIETQLPVNISTTLNTTTMNNLENEPKVEPEKRF
tara:strand:- start:693 stop:3242 length:2550 start_codon:yes stop_codon:yes gene_type:complete